MSALPAWSNTVPEAGDAGGVALQANTNWHGRGASRRYFTKAHPNNPESARVSEAKWASGLPAEQVKRNANGDRFIHGDAILPTGERLHDYLQSVARPVRRTLPPELLIRGGEVQRDAHNAFCRVMETFESKWREHPNLSKWCPRIIDEVFNLRQSDFKTASLQSDALHLSKQYARFKRGEVRDGRIRSGRKPGEFDARVCDYIDQEYVTTRRSLRSIVLDAQALAKSLGVPCPSYGYCLNTLIPSRYSKREICYAREGSRAYDEKFAPRMKRNYADYRALDVFVFDGVTLDVWVQLPGRDGLRSVKLVAIVVMDMATRRIVGWSLSESESWDATLHALFAAVKSAGVPAGWYYDCGSGFRKGLGNAWKNRVSLFADRLGSQLVNSIPGSPWSRGMIERLARTINEQFSARLVGYGGPGPGDHPEGVEQLRRKHPEALLTVAQLQAKLAEWVASYNARPHLGDGMGNRAPDDVWAEQIATVEVVRKGDDELRYAASVVIGPKTVQRDGIHHDRVVYGNRQDEVHRLIGQRVWLRIDFEEASSVAIVNERGDAILDPVSGAPIVATNERFSGVLQADIRQAARNRGKAKREVREHFKSRNVALETPTEAALAQAIARSGARTIVSGAADTGASSAAASIVQLPRDAGSVAAVLEAQTRAAERPPVAPRSLMDMLAEQATGTADAPRTPRPRFELRPDAEPERDGPSAAAQIYAAMASGNYEEREAG